jgi:hypothetical protein
MIKYEPEEQYASGRLETTTEFKTEVCVSKNVQKRADKLSIFFILVDCGDQDFEELEEKEMPASREFEASRKISRSQSKLTYTRILPKMSVRSHNNDHFVLYEFNAQMPIYHNKKSRIFYFYYLIENSQIGIIHCENSLDNNNQLREYEKLEKVSRNKLDGLIEFSKIAEGQTTSFTTSLINRFFSNTPDKIVMKKNIITYYLQMVDSYMFGNTIKEYHMNTIQNLINFYDSFCDKDPEFSFWFEKVL